MNWNITELAVSPGESINLSTIIGIIGGLFGIAGTLFGTYIWFYDRKNMRRATLYYPLYLACSGIIDVIENHPKLGEARSRSLFISCAKTLDEIIYNHGSLIHLKNVEDTRTFLSMKKAIDEKLESIEQDSWVALEDMFKSDEFKEIKKSAKTLLLRCGEEVTSLKKLSE